MKILIRTAFHTIKIFKSMLSEFLLKNVISILHIIILSLCFILTQRNFNTICLLKKGEVYHKHFLYARH